MRMKGEFSAINSQIAVAKNIILVTFHCSIFQIKIFTTNVAIQE